MKFAIALLSTILISNSAVLGAEVSQPLNSQAETSNPNSLHHGSDFKIGPVTDDSKLIKPVAGDHNKSITDDKNPQNDPAKKEEAEAGISDQRKTNQEFNFKGQGKISVGALRIAEELEILPVINSLAEWRSKHGNVRDSHDIESLALRQELHEDLFSAFLQTRRVISELDRQIVGYDAVARVLEDKRDQAIRTNNILNFTTAGALAVTQGSISIGTPTSYQNAGNEIGIIAGGLTALIGAYALKIEKGGKRDAEREPNMLAPVFDLAPVEPNKYPPAIWNYLNAYEPGQKNTRREQMIQRWRTLNYIDKDTNAKAMKHLHELCGTVPLKHKVNISLLRTRIPMLEDLRAAVAGMNEYLDEILTFVRGPDRIAIKYHTSAKVLDVLKSNSDKEQSKARSK